MRASLVSREVIADSIELVTFGHHLDAVVMLCGCDKTIPGTIMALAQLGSGQVYARFGGSVYFAMAGMAACGLIAALIAKRGSGETWLRA